MCLRSGFCCPGANAEAETLVKTQVKPAEAEALQNAQVIKPLSDAYARVQALENTQGSFQRQFVDEEI